MTPGLRELPGRTVGVGTAYPARGMKAISDHQATIRSALADAALNVSCREAATVRRHY